jgi:hypothetical protein
MGARRLQPRPSGMQDRPGLPGADAASAAESPIVPARHCGRCQSAFPGDPTLFFQTDWALCPDCTAILLPGRPA